MAIQRLNFTKRKKLTLDQVRVELVSPAGTGPRNFRVQLDLPSGLPSDALVVLEAYRNSPWARMRFPLGTVGKLVAVPPEGWTLTAFGSEAPPPLFRLKIIDLTSKPRGKIIASALGIRPTDTEPDVLSKKGILRTAWHDNDGLVWDLDLDDEGGPVLFIDVKADPERSLPSRIEFKALVYPEILRRVLTYAVVESPGSSEDPEHWASRWAAFPKEMFGFTETLPEEASADDRKEWVATAVKWCSRKAGFVAAMAPAEAEE